MFRIKRARSVIHSIAHHGVSALSWLHPTLGEECKSQNLESIGFNLTSGKFISKEFISSEETKNAFETLRETFSKIAESEGIDLSFIEKSTIVFGFERDEWPSYCLCGLNLSDGREISIKVDGWGRKYGPLSKYGAIYS